MRVEQVCSSWEGTRYKLNSCRKGIGVDCLHFAAAVIDELYGENSKDLQSLPPDACVHNRLGVLKAGRELLMKYPSFRRVRNDRFVEAGDLMMLGRREARLRSTQHLMVVGTEGKLWHATPPRVHFTGSVLPKNLMLTCIFRASDKENWPC